MEQCIPRLISEPPEVIYHYTTQEGLLGIVGKGEIWASDLRYLNDAAEYHLAFELIESEILQLQPLLPPAPPSSVFEQLNALNYSSTEPSVEDTHKRVKISATSNLINAVKDIRSRLCICSFSEKRDCLSQWRGYGQNGVAFSIGFYSKNIQGIAGGEKFSLGKCIYNLEDQKAVIHSLFKCILEDNTDILNNSGPWLNALRTLYTFVPLVKHHKFEEEEEWRLISQYIASKDSRLQFRQGVSMLVPYLCFPLKTEDHPLKIHSITVGPSPHKELSMASVQSFLISKGLDGVQILSSEVPYRNW